MLWLVIGLSACQDETRPLGVVGDVPDPVPGGTEDYPEGDTGGDAGESPMETQTTTACGGVEPPELPTGDEVLALDWCARVSPEEPYEPVDTGSTDTGAADTGATGPFGPPPPCGFVNLVGAVGLAGDPTDPAFLYCDSDADGGLRFVRYDLEAGVARTRLVAPLQCLPDVRSGSLLPVDGAWLVTWSANFEDQAEAAGVWVGRLDDEGRFLDEPAVVALSTQAIRSEVVGGDTPLLLVADLDETLWAVPVDATGRPDGALQVVTAAVRKFQAIPTASGALLAWCDADDVARVGQLDELGLLTAAVDLGSCGWDASPSVASDGVTTVVGWDDGIGGRLAFLDGLVPRFDVDLGELSIFPQVAWDGARFVSVDGLGGVHTWDSDGALTSDWLHPHIATYPGSLTDLRLLVTGGRVAFTLVGMDAVPIGGGHVNSYNYVELSSAALP